MYLYIIHPHGKKKFFVLKNHCIELSNFPKWILPGDQDAILSAQLQKLFFTLERMISSELENEMSMKSENQEKPMAELTSSVQEFLSPPASPSPNSDSPSILG